MVVETKKHNSIGTTSRKYWYKRIGKYDRDKQVYKKTPHIGKNA